MAEWVCGLLYAEVGLIQTAVRGLLYAEVGLIQTGVCGLLYAEVGVIQTGSVVCYKAGIRTDDNYDDDEDEDAAGDDITAMMRTKMLPVMITDGCMMCVAFCFFSIFLHGFIVSVRTYINEDSHHSCIMGL